MNNWNTFACILRVFRNYTQHHHNNSKCKFCMITPVNLTLGQRFFIVLAGTSNVIKVNYWLISSYFVAQILLAQRHILT